MTKFDLQGSIGFRYLTRVRSPRRYLLPGLHHSKKEKKEKSPVPGGSRGPAALAPAPDSHCPCGLALSGRFAPAESRHGLWRGTWPRPRGLSASSLSGAGGRAVVGTRRLASLRRSMDTRASASDSQERCPGESVCARAAWEHARFRDLGRGPGRGIAAVHSGVRSSEAPPPASAAAPFPIPTGPAGRQFPFLLAGTCYCPFFTL